MKANLSSSNDMTASITKTLHIQLFYIPSRGDNAFKLVKNLIFTEI